MPPQLGAQDQYFDDPDQHSDEPDQYYDEPDQYYDEPNHYNDEAKSNKKRWYFNFSVMDDSKFITYSFSGLIDVILQHWKEHSL